jgi:hypothetical protein
MKKLIALLLALTLIFPLTACIGDKVESANAEAISVEYDADDIDSDWNSVEASYIILDGDSVTLDGEGATVDGSETTITSAGTYILSGTLDDGQIIIDTTDLEIVRLVLSGVDITCSTSAPISIINAEKVVITLADGTENYVTDGNSYVFEDSESDEPNAAIFSKSDLTINGNGSLTVNANYNNGIQSKDELKITSGNITVNAANDGIKGRDYIAIKDGSITVVAGGDGMRSNNDKDLDKGFVAIEGGTISITAGEDGIQAETNLVISGGNIAISSGGGSAKSSRNIGEEGNTWCDWGDMGMDKGMSPDMVNMSDSGGSSGSAKGLKAGVNITITGGTINIDSSDDSIHSNDSLKINGGSITMASGDDGIHSDSTLEINGGDISITKCYEGIESAVIIINDGNIRIVASDDGINAAGGVDGSSIDGRPGQNSFNFSVDHYLYINGGYIVIDAAGDGLDINGSINMTGGTIIINGPTSNNNGALDYLGDFKITGGYLVAVGSSGMAQAPSTTSTRYSVMVNLSSSQPADTIVHFETEDGEDILTFVPTKAYQSVVLSSPELKNGLTCIVYYGGSSTGTVIDGLYSDGTYTAGTQVASFTISSIVTGAGSSGGGFPGGGGGNMPPRR